MCHHYDTNEIAEWTDLRETEEDEHATERNVEDDPQSDKQKEPATPPADD